MVCAVKCNKNSTITYGYNDRSEVTSADATNNANYEYGFAFDPIGNRTSAANYETGTQVTRNYTSNNLNHYTAIDNPTASPTYDFDGNMTSMPLGATQWTFTWDAENRLIAAVRNAGVPPGDYLKLEFSYDYMSRRVSKKVYAWDTDHWSLTSDLRFVYDGYLQIEELDGANSNALLKTRVWSPALQGLGSEKYLSETQGEATYYALGDANKNITDYLDASGNIKAHYEFSPFGKVVNATGTMSGDFNYRFSSEYLDIESGLVYYNWRYYTPELGRWLSRDPIGDISFNLIDMFTENKDVYNTYLTCDNNIINSYDYLGCYVIVKTITYYKKIFCHAFLPPSPKSTRCNAATSGAKSRTSSTGLWATIYYKIDIYIDINMIGLIPTPSFSYLKYTITELSQKPCKRYSDYVCECDPDAGWEWVLKKTWDE